MANVTLFTTFSFLSCCPAGKLQELQERGLRAMHANMCQHQFVRLTCNNAEEANRWANFPRRPRGHADPGDANRGLSWPAGKCGISRQLTTMSERTYCVQTFLISRYLSCAWESLVKSSNSTPLPAQTARFRHFQMTD